jgi:hypothetical protein
VIQLAHVFGWNAQRDHDLGERVALLEALENISAARMGMLITKLPERVPQLLHELRFLIRDAHRPALVAQRVLDDELVLAATQQEADRRMVIGLLEHVVDHR